MKNKVSFIIPTKNEEKRLASCIDSIKRCDKDGFYIEIIVVDNGSDDNTVSLARSLGAKTYIDPDATIGKLRNIGAKNSVGDILCFVDADVNVGVEFLLSLEEILEDSSVGIVTGPILLPDNPSWVELIWALGRNNRKGRLEVFWSSSMNMIVKRHVFDSVGGFSENMKTCEDVDFSRKVITLNYKIIYEHERNVVHMGEAKSLIGLYRKEKWRGKSIWMLFFKNINDPRRWLNICQLIYFLFATMFLLISIVLLNYELTIISVILIFTLPFIRSLNVVMKTKKLLYFPQLIIVWFVYYSARTRALF
ncbi:glycosyltransferase [Desulfuromonas sp. AOP6]|uniref:glycosyltransferase n=1 Tax=Desulfuromonas sp. AOP6 TaxID=1566351 RepID=UPI00126B61D6|nr:glycosyltransferase [Desulfuromonas sp. AOP6]BCA79505.1 hypothetical protein AOP6_1292 [Desulfuromonas sp. AOP6]